MKLCLKASFLMLGLSIFIPSITFADGESIYTQHCGSCHNGGLKGLMARAPKIGKDSAWKKYFLTGVDDTKNKVFIGTDKHKAMGKEANLSADEIGAAVDHILSETNINSQ